MKKPRKKEEPLPNLGLVRIPNVSVWYWTAPTDFVSFGEMLIGFVPTESGVSLAEAPGFLKAPGGTPAIVAIAVSRLGDDELGHMLAGILRKNGVADQGINFDTGARTALAFMTLVIGNLCFTGIIAPICCSVPMNSTSSSSDRYVNLFSLSIPHDLSRDPDGSRDS
ncbi:hypothetical protein F2Q69_00014662 [Brassica cretica]|uniref:Carbohydrate kinase PfkB domain-containing protein n=1 Tax=Brassica cretica TaxID=69181 RepID=A0A8S9R4K4_BRACR|nr:hypothetical protein F2Q69_00014662 [Brassica cretica]